MLGYGGFSVSIDPFFSLELLTMMYKYGLILAVPNIRGGGEFGEEWHLAGSLKNKVRLLLPVTFHPLVLYRFLFK